MSEAYATGNLSCATDAVPVLAHNGPEKPATHALVLYPYFQRSRSPRRTFAPAFAWLENFNRGWRPQVDLVAHRRAHADPARTEKLNYIEFADACFPSEVA